MKKDWTGNKPSVFVTNGAKGHSLEERENNDFYATDPKGLEVFLDEFELHKDVYECACGKGHLSEVLKARGYNVKSTDLIERGYGIGGVDFFDVEKCTSMDILTNPPYKVAREFVEHAIDIVNDGYYVVMFLKLTFLEGKARKELFKKYPPKYVYVSCSRINCAKNGEFENYPSSAVAYAWYV